MNTGDIRNVIAFMNMKGGVGKTTLCVNLADCLSKHFNKKILIIDLDPQMNATQYLINSKEYLHQILEQNRTILRVFQKDKVRPNIVCGPERFSVDIPDIEYRVRDNLYLIPGHLLLSKIQANAESQHALNRFIENTQLKERYDYIFVDSPPTQSIFTEAAFYASNYYIIPVKPDHLSSLGINSYMKSIEDRNESLPHRLRCIGIVFTMVGNSKYARQIIGEVRNSYRFYVFDNYIKCSILIPRNSRKNRCMYDIPSLRPGIIDVSQEFLNRIEM